LNKLTVLKTIKIATIEPKTFPVLAGSSQVNKALLGVGTGVVTGAEDIDDKSSKINL
jgi:hypothetical protein